MSEQWITAWAGLAMSLAVSGIGLLERGTPKNEPVADVQREDIDLREDIAEPSDLKCAMTLRLQVRPTDPAALLAVASRLDLNSAQRQKLERILASAREQAEGVLEADQFDTVAAIAQSPATPLGIHETLIRQADVAESLCEVIQ